MVSLYRVAFWGGSTCNWYGAKNIKNGDGFLHPHLIRLTKMNKKLVVSKLLEVAKIVIVI